MVNLLKLDINRIPLRPRPEVVRQIIPCKADLVAVLGCFAEQGVTSAPCLELLEQLDGCMETFAPPVRHFL